MGKLAENLLFSFLVSLPMVVLDGLYHLASETTVHLNYIIVKLLIIFLTVFFIAHWVGKSPREGLFSSIAGPGLFYIYYLFAYPTLNREVFRLDENFGYIFLHLLVLLIAYFTVFTFLVEKKTKVNFKPIASALLLALLVTGFDMFYQLSVVRAITGDDEQSARALGFEPEFILGGWVFAAALLGVHFFQKKPSKQAWIFIIGTGIISFLNWNDIFRALVGLIGAAVSLWLAKRDFNPVKG